MFDCFFFGGTHMVTDFDNLQIMSELAIKTLPDLEFERILQAS